MNKFIDMIITKEKENSIEWFSMKEFLIDIYIAFLSGLRSFDANSGKTSRNRIFGPG